MVSFDNRDQQSASASALAVEDVNQQGIGSEGAQEGSGQSLDPTELPYEIGRGLRQEPLPDLPFASVRDRLRLEVRGDRDTPDIFELASQHHTIPFEQVTHIIADPNSSPAQKVAALKNFQGSNDLSREELLSAVGQAMNMEDGTLHPALQQRLDAATTVEDLQALYDDQLAIDIAFRDNIFGLAENNRFTEEITSRIRSIRETDAAIDPSKSHLVSEGHVYIGPVVDREPKVELTREEQVREILLSEKSSTTEKIQQLGELREKFDINTTQGMRELVKDAITGPDGEVHPDFVERVNNADTIAELTRLQNEQEALNQEFKKGFLGFWGNNDLEDLIENKLERLEANREVNLKEEAYQQVEAALLFDPDMDVQTRIERIRAVQGNTEYDLSDQDIRNMIGRALNAEGGGLTPRAQRLYDEADTPEKVAALRDDLKALTKEFRNGPFGLWEVKRFDNLLKKK